MASRRVLTTALAVAAAATALPAPAAAQSAEYELPNVQQPPLYLTPVPVVRLVGGVNRRGTRVTLLRVKAPRGSRVRAVCRGGRRRGCRTASKTRTTPASGLVRFREMERMLRPGAVLEVFIRRGNTVGKHASFTMRYRKVPRRRDDCLIPGVSKPRACP